MKDIRELDRACIISDVLQPQVAVTQASATSGSLGSTDLRDGTSLNDGANVSCEITTLRKENEQLKARLLHLAQEVAFLRNHVTLSQGMRGETLIAKLAGGTLAAKYAQRYDIQVGATIRVEVKFSKVNTPSPRHRTLRRWNWCKPLGTKDKGKDFDFLVLVGEKDPRFGAQYLDSGSPYVFFVVPKAKVPEIMTKGATVGANVQINTNLASAKSPVALALKSYLVTPSLVSSLLGSKVDQQATTVVQSPD
jgi:hypothetical protein